MKALDTAHVARQVSATATSGDGTKCNYAEFILKSSNFTKNKNWSKRCPTASALQRYLSGSFWTCLREVIRRNRSTGTKSPHWNQVIANIAISWDHRRRFDPTKVQMKALDTAHMARQVSATATSGGGTKWNYDEFILKSSNFTKNI